MMSWRGMTCYWLFLSALGNQTMAQDTVAVRARGDSVVLRFVDADLRAVIRSIAPYLRKPIMTGEFPAHRVTLETPVPVHVNSVAALLRGLVEARGMRLVEDSAFYRVLEAPATPTQQTILQPQELELRLHVIPLKHARASEVAATVNMLYGVISDAAPRRGLSSGTLADELRRSGIPERDQPATPQATQRGSLSGPVTLVPDERTNTLLVRASDRDAAIIREAVTQLDLRPLQVLIEVLIVEVRKDRSFDLTTAGDISRETDKRSLAASVASANPGALVLQFMKLSRTEVGIRLSAAASRGDAKIVSRPVIVVSNNAEARFLVGSQRPFVQISRSLPTDIPVRDQVIQYRDVGTKLLVRPSINQDGYVSLLVQQEMSGATDETQFGAPIISTREASTEVLVRDGQTLVLGGLTDSNKSKVQSGFPILSAIPIIGGLFGEARTRTAETELFLFLTPRVIRTDDDVDSLTAPRLRPPNANGPTK
ncbi:MAG: type II secretion system protein GspD [Gemmatimonadaceae bacterium]